MLEKAANIIGQGGDLFTLTAHTRWGDIPVGLTSIAVQKPPDALKQIMPHFVWFPEASARNKLECSLRFLIAAKAEGNVILVARQPAWRFFAHLCNYGVIRPVGKLRGYFADGDDAMLYQGVRS